MSAFNLVAAFLALVAIAGWANSRWLRLPAEVAMVLAGLAAAAVLLVARAAGGLPQRAADFLTALRDLDFPQAVLGWLLAFLLFAGAMQVDLHELRRRRLSVWSLATVGVLASTALVGGGTWLAAKGLGLPLPLAWALVFGALISPTDPIAVLAAVRGGALSKSLRAVLQGEALFNDGVGIVVFLGMLAIARGGAGLSPANAVLAVVVQAGGGLVMGLVTGAFCVRAMRLIDDYPVEVAITLALAVGCYAVAQSLGFSGPIAVVAAGLMVGDAGVAKAMSETTRRYVLAFWTLVDELLNALIFLLLGLELVAVHLDLRHAGLWVAAIVLTLGVRWLVVAPWGAFFQGRRRDPGATTILAWGGLHGALSLALALSLPAGAARDLLLPATFVVVLFSVIVQGLSFPGLVRRIAQSGVTPAPGRSVDVG